MASIEQQVAHVWRRLGFGPTAEDIAGGVAAGGASATIEALLARPPTTESDWAFPAMTSEWDWASASRFVERHLANMAHGTNPLQERISWILHGLVVVSADAVDYRQMAAHTVFLRNRAFGSYKALLHDVTTTSAMLEYLSGAQNTKQHPNENFARELCELFSLGPVHPVTGAKNYTEDEIKEIARALTGWRLTWPPPRLVSFDSRYHDAGTKTYLGAQRAGGGAEEVATVVNAIAAHPSWTAFVPSRLYRELVGLEPSASVLAELGAAFGPEGDLRALVAAIVRRPEFISDAAIGSRVKSPVELVCALMRILRIQDPSWLGVMWRMQSRMGQNPFFAPNVNGWPSGVEWMHAGHLLAWSGMLMSALWWRDSGGNDVPAERRIQALRDLYTSSTPATIVDRSVSLAGLTEITGATRNALQSFATAGTWNHARAVGVLHLLLCSPDFFVN